jgi:hypothetical protein
MVPRLFLACSLSIPQWFLVYFLVAPWILPGYSLDASRLFLMVLIGFPGWFWFILQYVLGCPTPVS